MKTTHVKPTMFSVLKGEMVTLEWSPPKVGILNGIISGAKGIEPQAFNFMGGQQPGIEVDGRLQPAFLTMLCDGTWLLSIPSVIVGPQSVVRVRFLSDKTQSDGIEFIFGEDTSANEWLGAARKLQRANGGASVAS